MSCEEGPCWGSLLPLSFSIHTQGWGPLGGRMLRLTLLGVWPAGIWSNIFSLNLLDAWYDFTSSGDTWRQHIQDKIRDLGKEPGVRLLPLLMLQGWDGSTVGIRQHFQAPHWTNVCFSGLRGAPCLPGDLLMARDLVDAAWNSTGPDV